MQNKATGLPGVFTEYFLLIKTTKQQTVWQWNKFLISTKPQEFDARVLQ